jgi:endonuclease YncB( thermonuclease family)
MRVGTDFSGDAFAARPRQERRAAGERDPAVTGAQLPWREPDQAEESSEAKPTGGPRPHEELNEKERAQVARLRARDTEVRNHEAAHMAAAGSFGGGASFSYATGPDGNRYAVGGEVPVRMVGGRTPEEAIRNAAQVRAAALAPAEPSSQDMAVAAEASAMEADARAEMAAQRNAEAAAANPSRRTSEARPATPEIGSDRGDGSAEGGSAEASASSRAPTRELLPADDSEATMRQLEQERRTSSRGSWRHLHMASGCGGCAVAISSYS